MEPKITVIPPEDPALVRQRDHVREHDGAGYRRQGAGPEEGADLATTNASELEDPIIEPELLYDEERQQFTHVTTARAHGYDGSGYADHGMFAHRGVLDSEEYVDPDALLAGIEQLLGVSAARLRELYGGGRKGGPIPAALRAERDAVDAQLAELDHLALLAACLGIPETTLRDAAKRGRARTAG